MITAPVGVVDVKTAHAGLTDVMIAQDDQAGMKTLQEAVAGFVLAGLKTVYIFYVVVLPPRQHGLEHHGGVIGLGWASWRCEHQKVLL